MSGRGPRLREGPSAWARILSPAIIGALSIGALLPVRAALAAPNNGAAAALLRLSPVLVRVEPTTPSLEETGVTRALLDSLVVDGLGARGIPVERKGDSELAGGVDGLLSMQTTYLINSGWHIVSLSLYLTRSAALTADPQTEVTSTVWSRDGVVMARKKKLRGEVQTMVSELLDAFADAYRIANSR